MTEQTRPLSDETRSDQYPTDRYDYLLQPDTTYQTPVVGTLAVFGAIETPTKCEYSPRFVSIYEAMMPAHPKPVTHETLAKAAATVARVSAEDAHLQAIIRSNSISDDPYEIVQAIRSDEKTRLQVAAYYTTKLTSFIGIMPDRIVRNTEKHPKTKGMEHTVRSQEYAVLLALSKLDGTFDSAASAQDKIVYDSLGNVELGQHRVAADILLFQDEV